MAKSKFNSKNIKIRSLIILFFLLLIFTSGYNLFAAAGIFNTLQKGPEYQYIVRLNNGDLLTGYVVETVSNYDLGEGIKFRTDLGAATIYESQASEITEGPDYYRHSHRVFLLPTAKPIGKNHFAGIFELMFLYAGAGIGDFLSITAGRSMLPGVNSYEQLSELNIKATLFDEPFENMTGSLSVALGSNLAFINSDNRLIHAYGVATFTGAKSIITGCVFYKFGGQDYYTLHFATNQVDMLYENGSFGLGIGLDTKFSSRHGLHFIGELWNNNIAKPTNTGILLGLRLCDTQFSADFGLTFFTQPFVVPVASFTWTPF